MVCEGCVDVGWRACGEIVDMHIWLGKISLQATSMINHSQYHVTSSFRIDYKFLGAFDFLQ